MLKEENEINYDDYSKIINQLPAEMQVAIYNPADPETDDFLDFVNNLPELRQNLTFLIMDHLNGNSTKYSPDEIEDLKLLIAYLENLTN